MRRKWRRIRSLSFRQLRVLAASLMLMPMVQFALRRKGFSRTAGALAARSDRPVRTASPADVRELAVPVGMVASRKVVGAACLGRSLVLWFLARRRGFDVELVIGAAAPQDGVLPAHAWVEYDGVPVNDSLDVRERFGSFEVQLPRLSAAVAP